MYAKKKSKMRYGESEETGLYAHWWAYREKSAVNAFKKGVKLGIIPDSGLYSFWFIWVWRKKSERATRCQSS